MRPQVRRAAMEVRRGDAGSPGQGRLREIAPGVFCLGPWGRTQTNIYFVRSGPSWVLVDAGWIGDRHRVQHAALQLFGGQPPGAILLTHDHPDHEGAALALAREWGCPVFVHPEELPVAVRDFAAMRAHAMPLDRWFVFPIMWTMGRRRRDEVFARASLTDVVETFTPQSGVPFLPDWECIETPGHTPGHVSLFRAADRVLISGDAVVTLKMSLLGLLRQQQGLSGPPWYTTWNHRAARASVQRLARLEPTVLASGHGQPLTEGTTRQLHEFAATGWRAGGRRRL
jgi:glyoxylase-like metal-dependent hydrolase (beta-lactamase superfamily II)